MNHSSPTTQAGELGLTSSTNNHTWAPFNVQRRVYSVTVPALLAYCFLSFAVNCAVACTTLFMKNRKKNKSATSSTVRLTISLVATDMCTSLAMSFGLVYNSYLFYVRGVKPQLCVVLTAEAVRMGLFFTDLCHLLLLAVNHYVTMAHPLVYARLVTPRRVGALLAFVWLTPVGCMLTLFASIPGQGYRSPAGRCGRLAFASRIEYRTVVSSIIVLFIVCMAVVYTLAFLALRRQQRSMAHAQQQNQHQKTRDDDQTTSKTTGIYGKCNINNSGGGSHHYRQCGRALERNRRALYTTLLLWTAFFLGWFPTCVFFVLTSVDRPPGSSSNDQHFRNNSNHSIVAVNYSNNNHSNNRHRLVSGPMIFVLGFMSSFFILTKTLANPIIYAVRVPEIRLVLKEMSDQAMRQISCTSNALTAPIVSRLSWSLTHSRGSGQFLSALRSNSSHSQASANAAQQRNKRHMTIESLFVVPPSYKRGVSV